MTTQSQKPQLEICLEDLQAVCGELLAVSKAYQKMRAMVADVTESPDEANLGQFPLAIMIPGTDVQVTVPIGQVAQQPEQVVELLESAVDELGAQVMNAWAKAHKITGNACQHCQAAVSHATQQAEG